MYCITGDCLRHYSLLGFFSCWIMYLYQISFMFSYVWLPRPFVLCVFGVGYLLCSLRGFFSVMSFSVDYFVRTRTVHSNLPNPGLPGSPLCVIFCACVLWLFCPWFFVSFRFVSWFFLSPFWFLVSSVCWYYQSIHLCVIKQFTHTLNIDILYSNKCLDVEISSSKNQPHNYINNLKCVEWQRPDDGHYRPKHVVFWPRI